MSEIVVVQYGVLPSDEYEVLARGDSATRKAQELGIVEEGPVSWDGSVNHVAIGGKYTVISEDATEEQLRAVQDEHEVEAEDVDNNRFGSSVITSDGEVEQVNIIDI